MNQIDLSYNEAVAALALALEGRVSPRADKNVGRPCHR